MGDEGVNGGAEAAAPVPVSSPVSHCFPLSSQHNKIADVITAALLLSACVCVCELCVCEFMCELCVWCKRSQLAFRAHAVSVHVAALMSLHHFSCCRDCCQLSVFPSVYATPTPTVARFVCSYELTNLTTSLVRGIHALSCVRASPPPQTNASTPPALPAHPLILLPADSPA